jgi:adenylate cyclase
MSVLFSDICGFTQLSGRLSPAEVINLLNEYFDVLCPIVKGEGGDIDKFIGDAIMAVFDDLPNREPAPVRAARAGLAMQAAMEGFNAGRDPRLAMRVGINTGHVVRGDLGSRFVRRDYTVIGDTVNRANRYEANCPPGRVLVSESTLEAAGGAIQADPLPGLKLKGVDEPVRGWVVKSITPKVDGGSA